MKVFSYQAAPDENRSLPCMAKGETNVDGAVMPVACDLWHGHPATHFDETVFTFWHPDWNPAAIARAAALAGDER